MMSQRIVTECDDCLDGGVERVAETVEVAALGHVFEVDLCDVHRKPLVDLVDRLVFLGRPVGQHGGASACPRCGRRFATPQALGRHTKAAHGEKVREAREATVVVEPDSHACPDCGRTFPRAQGLAVHRRRKHGVAGASKSTASRRGAATEAGESPEGE